MNEVETKPLTKHIQTAVNAIKKEIAKKQNQVDKLIEKSNTAQQQAFDIENEISGLEEQISKLKGE